MSQTNQPTEAQMAALRKYAAQHGRTWKSQLQTDWMYSRAGAELQQVRNTLGPSWLVRFKLPNA